MWTVPPINRQHTRTYPPYLGQHSRKYGSYIPHVLAGLILEMPSRIENTIFAEYMKIAVSSRFMRWQVLNLSFSFFLRTGLGGKEGGGGEFLG